MNRIKAILNVYFAILMLCVLFCNSVYTSAFFVLGGFFVSIVAFGYIIKHPNNKEKETIKNMLNIF